MTFRPGIGYPLTVSYLQSRIFLADTLSLNSPALLILKDFARVMSKVFHDGSSPYPSVLPERSCHKGVNVQFFH